MPLTVNLRYVYLCSAINLRYVHLRSATYHQTQVCSSTQCHLPSISGIFIYAVPLTVILRYVHICSATYHQSQVYSSTQCLTINLRYVHLRSATYHQSQVCSSTQCHLPSNSGMFIYAVSLTVNLRYVHLCSAINLRYVHLRSATYHQSQVCSSTQCHLPSNSGMFIYAVSLTINLRYVHLRSATYHQSQVCSSKQCHLPSISGIFIYAVPSISGMFIYAVPLTIKLRLALWIISFCSIFANCEHLKENGNEMAFFLQNYQKCYISSSHLSWSIRPLSWSVWPLSWSVWPLSWSVWPLSNFRHFIRSLAAFSKLLKMFFHCIQFNLL